MKTFTVSSAIAAFAAQAAAFPAAMNNLGSDSQLAQAAVEKRQLLGINVHFDPKSQYVSNTGEHAFQAPGPNDIRGPCPGLNAMANHNYIPRNGVASIAQFVDGTDRVFGMAADLAGFLSVYGAIFDGDLLGWSIGGPPPASLVSPLAGLIGQPQGISGSHNKYESDVSPTRGDLYTTGNDYKVVLDLFKGLYALQGDKSNEDSNYDLGILQSWRISRFQDSISTNPYFFNGPFSGVLVQPAAYTFIYRFMANKSAEFPEGRLSQDVLKSFFSITGDSPDEFVYTEGHEKIPDNWYKRALGDEYSIPFFLLDVVGEAVSNPQFLDIGGNLGEVNTFAPLDIQNITGGVYSLTNLVEGNNLQCFTFQLLTQAGPDILEGLLSNVGEALHLMNNVIGQILLGLGCPQLSDKTYGQYKEATQKYPGATKLSNTGTY